MVDLVFRTSNLDSSTILAVVSARMDDIIAITCDSLNDKCTRVPTRIESMWPPYTIKATKESHKISSSGSVVTKQIESSECVVSSVPSVSKRPGRPDTSMVTSVEIALLHSPDLAAWSHR
jgi:hypothetical protein